MEYIAIFFTHSGAVKYNRYLKKNDIFCELMPVPRKLSSNCGIGAKFTYDNDINNVISEDIEKVFKLSGKEYNMIYEAE